MFPRLPHAPIKEEFRKEGYELLSTYRNNAQRLRFICPSGHRHSISYGSWSFGHRCGKCAGTSKYTISEVRRSFESEGYRLVSSRYINSREKIKFVCSEGHSGAIRFGNWNQGIRCKWCAVDDRSGENSHFWKKDKVNDLLDFRVYKKRIQLVTERSYNRFGPTINPESLPRGRFTYNIDHLYSIRDGFVNGVPIDIISSPPNLRVITWEENRDKFSNSNITLLELYKRYRDWIIENGCNGGSMVLRIKRR